jgi:hypothetical protein
MLATTISTRGFFPSPLSILLFQSRRSRRGAKTVRDLQRRVNLADVGRESKREHEYIKCVVSVYLPYFVILLAALVRESE